MAIKPIMTVEQFIKKLNTALTTGTVYATGGFGASIAENTDKSKSQLERYYKNTKENCGTEYANKVLSAAKKSPCFAFDCVGLVKGIIWGWNADKNALYGGAEYESNGLDDCGAGIGGLISKCTDVSTDFSKIVAGELLWLNGHVGVYIGDGMAIECTTAWDDKVQKVECWNVKKTGIGRKWSKHGKLPWVDYSAKPKANSYSVVIGPFDTRPEASSIQAALNVLGTWETTIKENSK